MRSRRSSVAFAALLALGLSGCAATPAPTPSPTATGFATEEEAFAAAEALYRKHVDDLNAYYAGDKEYDPADYLSGPPLEEEREVHRQMEELQLTIVGDLFIRSLERRSVEEVSGAFAIELASCLDYSDTKVLDAAGNDVTPEREELVALDVSIATVDGPRLAIVRSTVSEAGPCT